ncbi:hypothetical protein HDZ31DRAFT_29029 [Schizophyllum fasciatum]
MNGPSTSNGVPMDVDGTRGKQRQSFETSRAVGYVYSTEMLGHCKPEGHEEQPARITRIYEALQASGCIDSMIRLKIRPALKEEVVLVHSEDHWNKIMAFQYMTDQQIADSANFYEHLSLYVCQATTLAARISCGGVIEACLAVARGQVAKSFAIVRPPGHHAEPEEHSGFCFLNNVAVAARVVQQATDVKKIMILDWDIHHGNGTHRAFIDDPTVLYISLHRYDGGVFYPGGTLGGMSSCGEGPGLGYSVNIPWPQSGMTDADYIHAFQRIVMPIALEFAPELVIISSGFDAADGDTLGECHVSPAGYSHMTHMLASLAGGKLVVALEGGYNLDSISASADAVAHIILGGAPDILGPMVATEAGTETVYLVAQEQSKYWENVDPKACLPKEGVLPEIEDLAHTIPDLLKAHRQYYLYTEHDMMSIPLLTPELEEAFSSQIMCTSDVFDKETMVVLVHEFGNLRTELQNLATCDLNIERSYLVDFSKQIMTWVRSMGYSLIDINLYPKANAPATAPMHRRYHYKARDDLERNVLCYVWDNFIQLSGAKNVVLIGHGPGCKTLIDVMEMRAAGVKRLVKALVQVVGTTPSLTVPNADDVQLIEWYGQHSLAVLSSAHPDLRPNVKRKFKRLGPYTAIDDPQSYRVIMTAFQDIKAFIQDQLKPLETPQPGPSNGA